MGKCKNKIDDDCFYFVYGYDSIPEWFKELSDSIYSNGSIIVKDSDSNIYVFSNYEDFTKEYVITEHEIISMFKTGDRVFHRSNYCHTFIVDESPRVDSFNIRGVNQNGDVILFEVFGFELEPYISCKHGNN